jgi:hypothetical protein
MQQLLLARIDNVLEVGIQKPSAPQPSKRMAQQAGGSTEPGCAGRKVGLGIRAGSQRSNTQAEAS